MHKRFQDPCKSHYVDSISLGKRCMSWRHEARGRYTLNQESYETQVQKLAEVAQ